MTALAAVGGNGEAGPAFKAFFFSSQGSEEAPHSKSRSQTPAASVGSLRQQTASETAHVLKFEHSGKNRFAPATQVAF